MASGTGDEELRHSSTEYHFTLRLGGINVYANPSAGAAVSGDFLTGARLIWATA
jgi:hypothetical protein